MLSLDLIVSSLCLICVFPNSCFLSPFLYHSSSQKQSFLLNMLFLVFNLSTLYHSSSQKQPFSLKCVTLLSLYTVILARTIIIITRICHFQPLRANLSLFMCIPFEITQSRLFLAQIIVILYRNYRQEQSFYTVIIVRNSHFIP